MRPFRPSPGPAGSAPAPSATVPARVRVLVVVLLLVLTGGLAPALPAGAAPASAPAPATGTPPSTANPDPFAPRRVARPVDPADARWTSGFWFERTEHARTRLVPAMFRLMEGTNVSQYLENFRLAAGLATGRPRGAPFNDGDFYKLLEAAVATLATHPDPALDQAVESAIAVIAQAQRADGYLHTPVLARARLGDREAVPFRDRNHFELYNLGHLMTAACLHHRVTGRNGFLDVARKAAGFLDHATRETAPGAFRGSVCPSHFMGLVDLAQTTGDARPTQLAARLFALREQVTDGGDDNQDRIPFARQDHAMGHAVRANYLYAGAADLFLETGEARFRDPLGPIWTNLVQRKMHVTGGCGALYDGASPDGGRDQGAITRVHQAYGRNFQLPNTTAHNETCAAIGNLLFNGRLFLATGDARHIDLVELTLHNGILSGVALDEPAYFYTNPLRVTDPLPEPLRWSRTRVPYVSAFCCPPNLLRTLARSATHAYARAADTLWVNLYGASRLDTRLDSGPVALVQESAFPWDGKVTLRFTAAPASPFALRLRVPGWSSARDGGGLDLRLNDAPVPATRDSLGYLEIRRPWRAGDTVTFELPMPVRLLEGHPLAEEILNQLAVQRGPVVYCLESADLPPGIRITDVLLAEDAVLVPRHDPRLLGGCVALEGRVRVRRSPPWDGALYRPVPSSSTTTESVATRFVPYALWGNRGRGEMTVWIPRSPASTPASSRN